MHRVAATPARGRPSGRGCRSRRRRPVRAAPRASSTASTTESSSAAVSARATSRWARWWTRSPRRPRPPGASCLPGRRRSRSRRHDPATIQRCMSAPNGPDAPPEYTKYRTRPSCSAGRSDAVRGRRRTASRARLPAEPGRRRCTAPGPWPRRAVGRARARRLGRALARALPRQRPDPAGQGLRCRRRASSAARASRSIEPEHDPGPRLRPARRRDRGARGRRRAGPGRSDSILLLRAGGGAQLAAVDRRATRVVDIPGHGRNKINAAYAFGGAALAVRDGRAVPRARRSTTSSRSTSTNFPDLIDAMGGINYTGGCVVSRINGGYENGGFTLRLRARHDAHRRRPGARARAHAQERLQPQRERPDPRPPPAAASSAR